MKTSISVSLPLDILKKIEKRKKETGLSRSKLVAKILRKQLGEKNEQ